MCPSATAANMTDRGLHLGAGIVVAVEGVHPLVMILLSKIFAAVS